MAGMQRYFPSIEIQNVSVNTRLVPGTTDNVILLALKER
jgi:hypothetical protein